jgi:hypothetical protein
VQGFCGSNSDDLGALISRVGGQHDMVERRPADPAVTAAPLFTALRDGDACTDAEQSLVDQYERFVGILGAREL